MKDRFVLNYENIVLTNLITIGYFEELINFTSYTENITDEIYSIFDKLQRLKKDKVFKGKDVMIAYRLIYNEIWRIDDNLFVLNSENLAICIYEVINNIFEELILLCLDFEEYEMAQNLTNIREFWFKRVDVKTIIKQGAKK